jgi:integrase
MGYYTGMRLGEILKIRWQNADLPVGEIRLDPGTTKNDEPRTVPHLGEFPEMLKIERAKSPGAVFIFTRDGQRIRSLYKAWPDAIFWGNGAGSTLSAGTIKFGKAISCFENCTTSMFPLKLTNN